MAVRTRDDIMAAVRARIGDDVDDDTLTLLEDLDDTIKAGEKSEGGEDWEQKYKDLDADWRKRYRDRFFSQGEEGDGENDAEKMPDEPEDEGKPTKFEDLFTTE